MTTPPSAYGLKHKAGVRLVRGAGAYCWDEMGRKYLDLTCGYGPIILGHANPEITETVAERLSKGHLFAWSSPEHEQLATELCERFVGTEAVVFTKTGSEAISAAVRVARTATGRRQVVRCGFHGWHDPLIAPHFKWHEYDRVIGGGNAVPGVAPADTADWRIWSGASSAELMQILEEGRSNVACVIIDASQLSHPIGENLRSIKQIVGATGALLVLDEIKTGFRVHRGGVQGRYGCSADLTIVSKALANGMPIAAVIGCRELIQCADETRIKGTFNGELASVAAALKTLQILDREDAPAKLETLGQILLARLETATKRTGAPVQAVPYQWSCMPHLHFTSPNPDRKRQAKRFGELMTTRGVMMLESHMNYVSLAMTSVDLEFAADATEESLRLL